MTIENPSAGLTACIVLNYRDPQSTLRAVESLLNSVGRAVKIYVVDNASPDDSAAILEKQSRGRFELLVNPKNAGYAGGMNFGLRRALSDGAEWVWLITQDITVEPDSLATLHGLWPRLDRPGFLGSLTDFNGTENLYYHRSVIDNGRPRHLTKNRSLREIPELKNEFGPTDYVNGACVFSHRSVIEKVGFIPEEYFMYFEDCEWGLTARRLGFENYVSYRSRVHHWRDLEGFNAGAEYYCRRNSYLFKKRNGFARPWTKAFELGRLMKLYGKSRLKSFLNSQHETAPRLAPIIKEVLADLRQEKFGPRSTPRDPSSIQF